jgi:DNA ligase (NAD+)
MALIFAVQFLIVLFCAKFSQIMRYDSQKARQLTALTVQYLSNPLELKAEQSMNELKEILNFHEYLYYVLNQPVISDYEYDLLYKQLQKIELENPNLISPDSPTQRISVDFTGELDTVPHYSPMLSLENSYNKEDIVDFDNQVRKWTKISNEEIIDYCIEPKFDGGTIVLVYENDLLIRAATRGNGIEGEEITNNVRAIRSVPIKALFSEKGIYRVELRGEALIRKDRFEIINQERVKQGLPLFANPRNAATGGLRVKDVKDIQGRGLEIFVYQISIAFDRDGQNITPNLKNHYDTLVWLSQLGFKVAISETSKSHQIDGVMDICKQWEDKRNSYQYEIDGMVIKVNDYQLQEMCGSTSHHPRWAVAFKFKAKQATSILKHVEFQVGKTGAVTPVAKIEPVPLAGVTISSVSLHNEEFIMSRDIRIGDSVLVERAGDVIPYIVKSFPELRTGDEQIIAFPTLCPSCSNPLTKSEEEAAWRCENEDCPAQSLQRLIHHVSKDGMDIDGFGKAIVERFFDLGWIKDIADVYELDFDKVSALDGFKDKSAQNLKQAIERAKKNPINMLLQSLSIRQLGKRAAKLISNEIQNLEDLYHWSESEYTKIKEIGPILAGNMVAYFNNPENIRILERMKQAGVNMQGVQESSSDIPVDSEFFSGKKILFTGSLQAMTRQDAQSLSEKAGAINISAVSSNLDILVTGENAGSKLKKATQLGTVLIITEQDFINELSKIGLV